MRRNFTFVFMTLALLFTGVKASANGEHTFEMQAESQAWASESTSFEMSEIAAELGIDAATLSAAIDEWYNAGYASDFFMLKLADGTWSQEHGSAADGAFYIGQDGDFHNGWGDAAGYCRLDYDDTTISITIGQTGSVEDGLIKAVCSINYNGQQVVFNANLQIGTPAIDIDKEPVTTIANLQVVGQTTYKHTQELFDEWQEEANSIPVKGISEALGIDSVYMAEHFASMVFVKEFDSNEESWSKELVHKFTSTPSPGFWFNTGVWDEETQSESTELTLGSYDGSSANMFYICDMAYNTGTDAIDCQIGQYPSRWTLGENHQADIYIVYGEKAYIITLDLTTDMELNPISNYTKIGSADFNIAHDPRGGWTTTDSLAVDMNAILKAFSAAGSELSAADLVLYGLDNHGSITNAYTADNAGFWMTADNKVTSYSESSADIFVELLNDSVNTEAWYLKVGNTPDMFDGGEEFADTLYLINGKNYYALNIALKMNEPTYKLADCETVEQDLTVQLVPSESAWEIGSTDVKDIEALIGTSEGILYGVTSAGEFTNSYSVSEASNYGGGGFWMSAADDNGMAYAASYSGDGAYAMWYYQSEITWFNIPGLAKAGDVRYGTFYIADLWNGKAVKLNVTLKFVSEIIDITPVATEDVNVAGRNDSGDDIAEQTLSLTAACEKLGCTEDELNEAGEWFVMDANGSLTSENFDDMYGYGFDAEGNAVADAANIVFYVGYADGLIKSYIVDDANISNSYKTVLYLKYNNKYYTFNVAINESATAITSVEEANADDSAIYDLAGRKVATPSKGIYVKGGKKYLVK